MSRAGLATRRRPHAFTTVCAIAALVLIGLIAWRLTAGAVRVTATSGTKPRGFVATVPSRGGSVCQPEDRLPAATARLVLTIGTYAKPGPAFDVVAKTSAGEQSLGGLAAGWHEGVVDVPLRRHGAVTAFTLCFRFDRGTKVSVAGETYGTHTVRGGPDLPGRLSVIGLTGEKRSLLSLLGVLGQRIPKGGGAALGAWSSALIGLLFFAAVALGALAIGATERDTQRSAAGPSGGRALRRVPAAGRALASAAACLGVAWAVLIPPFQVADETSHVAYVQYIAEQGALPKQDDSLPPYSEEERAVLDAVGFSRIIGRDTERALQTPKQEADLRLVERRTYGTPNAGNASTASANPPLYYLLQAPLFLATQWLGLTNQVLAMRLLSVLLTSLSVLLAYLFVRELLPHSPWSWTAAGLACAFLPILGFAGAGVNPDALLFASASATLLLTARILRRGLTARRACVLGLSVAVGMLTKPLFIALLPIAVAGLVLGARRVSHADRRSVALGLACALVPTLLGALVAAVVFDHPYLAAASSVASDAATSASSYTRAKELSYLLQLYLPRAPFLLDQIPGQPLHDVWINGIVGVFGWIDYGFPGAVVDLGTKVFVGLLALAAVAVVRGRRAVLADWRLLLCCVGALVAVLGAIGLVDFQSQQSGGFKFEQARYLLPLLCLYGGLFGLAIKGLGARLGRYAVPIVWVLVAFHTFAALSLTANRYYL